MLFRIALLRPWTSGHGYEQPDDYRFEDEQQSLLLADHEILTALKLPTRR
jgi:hypothetical protein